VCGLVAVSASCPRGREGSLRLQGPLPFDDLGPPGVHHDRWGSLGLGEVAVFPAWQSVYLYPNRGRAERVYVDFCLYTVTVVR
jgi:hypothetical protein